MQRHFATTCSCGLKVPAGQRCGCKPPREAERLQRDPSRAGYRTPEYAKARRAAIARATVDGTLRCEGCGIVVGLRRDRRGRAADYQTHHRDGNPMRNPVDGSNLAVLCEGKGTNRCHTRAEARLRNRA